jgi:hypothetical protein
VKLAASLTGWRLAGQIACYGLFVAFVGYFSSAPAYRHLPPEMATIKLSLRHAGQLLGECRTRSAEELGAMPASMRAPLDCPRERSPLLLELEADGELLYSERLPARGVHSDGRASVYKRLTVPEGRVAITVRLKDHIEHDDFHYSATRQLVLAAAGNLVIDFNEESRAFEFSSSERSPSNERTTL